MNKYENALEVIGKAIVDIPTIDMQKLPVKGFYPCEYKALEEACENAEKAEKYDELVKMFSYIDGMSPIEIIKSIQKESLKENDTLKNKNYNDLKNSYDILNARNQELENEIEYLNTKLNLNNENISILENIKNDNEKTINYLYSRIEPLNKDIDTLIEGINAMRSYFRFMEGVDENGNDVIAYYDITDKEYYTIINHDDLHYHDVKELLDTLRRLRK